MKEAAADIARKRQAGDKSAGFEDYDIPRPPFKYTVMKYRQKTGMGYAEVVSLPYSILHEDMEMLDIEAEYGQ